MADIDIGKLLNSMRSGSSMDKTDISKKKTNGGNKNKTNTENYKSSKNGRAEEMHYVGAPYNFIPFTKKLYTYEKPIPAAHNSVQEELMSGEIDYEITAQTSILVDDGTGHFHKNPGGKYSIPGSSMRGLIRSNVQILGFSGFDEDIDDYALMYRDVAGARSARKERYNEVLGSSLLPIGNGKNISILKNVKAGYIKKEGNKYYIYQTCIENIEKEKHGDMNYYILTERKMGDQYIEYLKRGKKGRYPYDFFIQNGSYLTQHLLHEKFNRIVRTNRNGKEQVSYKGTVNRKYKPFYQSISYEITNQKDVVAVGNPGEYQHNGVAISTGAMNDKKVIYIIPELDMKKNVIEIPLADVEAFNIDLKKRENTLKQFGGKEFFGLPEEGDLKPVFYIELDGRLYFGFTPRLRLFYDHTIKEGLDSRQKMGNLDYAKAIFGYSNEKGSYKSRVSFSDAVVIEDVMEENERKFILAEPKPTSYLDYLKQNKKDQVTYNTDDFELRGVKQYWLHKNAMLENTDAGKENVASIFNPLPKGTKFKGKVRFHNLKKDELGLLLWAIHLEEDSWMNIGKAKSYGFGVISVDSMRVRVMDKQKAYLLSETLDLDPFIHITTEDLISEYKNHIAKKLGLESVEKSPRIQSFLLMKDSRKIPETDAVKYMSIDRKDYQNRKRPLPEIKEVIDRKNKK